MGTATTTMAMTATTATATTATTAPPCIASTSAPSSSLPSSPPWAATSSRPESRRQPSSPSESKGQEYQVDCHSLSMYTRVVCSLFLSSVRVVQNHVHEMLNKVSLGS